MPLRYQLPNGLTVVFQPQHAAKVAAFQVWVRVGSADERPDQAGLAHLHEHMLFKGTATRGPGEIARSIEAHGGEINAWTSFDQTVYHVVIASAFAEEGLRILGDAVRFPSFDPGELGREIEVVCEEIKRSLDSPSRRASRDLFETAFGVHPYRRPVIGWEQTVRSFDREKVLEFYHRHYVPENIVLSVVGDLEEQALRGWVEEVFGGDWGRKGEGAVSREAEPAPSGRRFALRHDEVKEIYFNLAFAAPHVLHPDVPALDVLAMIAGQGDSSRLSLEVKRKQALVNDVQCWAYTPSDPGIFGASLTLPPGRLEEAVEQTVRVLAGLCAQPVGEQELRTVQALMEAENVYQRETVQGLARKLGYYQASGGGLEREAEYYDRVARLTPGAVQEVAQRYLQFDQLVCTGLLPAGEPLDQKAVEAAVERGLSHAPRPNLERAADELPPAPMRVTSALAATKELGEVVLHRLSSGAQVLVREEAAVPLFALRAAFLGGLRHETQLNNGVSTLLSRAFTRGTPTRGAEEISHQIDSMQGSLGASSGRNSVMLRGEFLSRHFERAFDLVAEVLNQPSFPEEEVERERALLLQDIHTREDKPAGVAMDLFAHTLFREHPYRLPLQGTRQSVEGLGSAQLLDYHRDHLDPSQLVLCVVGDVRAEEVISRAEAAFGKGRGGAVAKVQVADEPPPSSRREVTKVLAKAQTHLVLGFRGARVTDGWRRSLEVLSTVLSGQGGRLFVELRDKRSMAYSVSSFAVEGLEPGWFAVYMGTSPEKVADAVEGIRAELRRVREEPISAEELLRAKRHLVGTHEIGLQRNGARASMLALEHLYGLGTDGLQRYAGEISQVTAEQVREVARRVIDFDAETCVTVGPQGAPG